MRYLIIFNPGSKGGKNHGKISDIKNHFDKLKVEYQIKVTTTLEDAYNFSSEGNKIGIERIIAVGGDGTINRVLNGFFHSDGTRNSKSQLGIIYTGTSPDFCKSYRIPLDFKSALLNVTGDSVTSVEVGMIKYSTNSKKSLKNSYLEEKSEEDNDSVKDKFNYLENEDNYLEKYKEKEENEKKEDNKENNKENKTGYFFCCVNLGLGASLARGANGGIRKYLGDIIGTFVVLIGILMKFRGSTLVIKIDGVEKEIANLFNLSIGITEYIASGIKVNIPKGRREKSFYILEVKNVTLRNVFSILKTLYGGKKISSTNYMEISSGQIIEIQGRTKDFEVEFDGDPMGYLPCKISMAEKIEVIKNI